MPRRAQPGAQLDVLDARPEVAFGEAADGRMDRSADGTAARPKSLGLASTLLVHVVMKQILESTHPAWRRWLVVVGTEGGRERWLADEDAFEAGQGVGVDRHVRVHEHEHVATRPCGAAVARKGRSMRLARKRHNLRLEFVRARRRAIRADVVDHDDLVRSARRMRQGLEARAQVRAAVVHGNDDRELHRPASTPRARSALAMPSARYTARSSRAEIAPNTRNTNR